MAGLPPGFYRTELCELEIKADGRIVLAGQKQLLAGASRWILDGVANVMSFAGVDFRAAVEMATKNPARLLNAPCASFSVGETAEYVLLDRRSTGENREELSVRHVLCAEPS